jgi:hypothetical protein
MLFLIGLFTIYVIWIFFFPSKHIVEMDWINKNSNAFSVNYLIFLFFKNLYVWKSWNIHRMNFIYLLFGESLRKIIMIKEKKSSRHHCWNVGNCKFQLYLIILYSQFFFKILKMCTSWNFWCFSFGQSVKKNLMFIYIFKTWLLKCIKFHDSNAFSIKLNSYFSIKIWMMCKSWENLLSWSFFSHLGIVWK